MARRLPPLNALRAFEASARLGSFVTAAQELRVSAAAVSQQVRRLEEYLDTTLASFANGWLLPRLHRFRERAPRIDVVMRTSRHLMDFRRDAIDLAIRFAPGPGRGLHGELLCREELFPVASPALFGGGRMPGTLESLAD